MPIVSHVRQRHATPLLTEFSPWNDSSVVKYDTVLTDDLDRIALVDENPGGLGGVF